MKTENCFKSLIVLVLFLPAMFFSACEKDKGTSEESKQIKDQSDAVWAAFAISCAFKDNCPRYSTNWSYSNRVQYGGLSGSATINGSYYYTQTGTSWSGTSYSKLSNVKVVFDNYQNDSDYPRISGTGYFNGTLVCEYSTGGNDYSGGWTISGNFALAGQYEEEDISIYLAFYDESHYHGTLSVRGMSYNVE